MSDAQEKAIETMAGEFARCCGPAVDDPRVCEPRVRVLFRQLGLVAVDPALIEGARQAQRVLDEVRVRIVDGIENEEDLALRQHAVWMMETARLQVADAVLAALEPPLDGKPKP